MILVTFREHLKDSKPPSLAGSCLINSDIWGVFPQLGVDVQPELGVPLWGRSHRQCGPSRPGTHLGFSEEELQVSATQNAVVLHVAGNVHSAGAVHGAVHLHVVVDGVQVFLFILKQKQRLL